MRKFIVTTVASVISLPALADDARLIDLDAGLWEYSIVLEVGHIGVVTRDTEQFCLSDADASMTTNDLLNEISGGQCSSFGEVVSVGSSSADMTCLYPDDNARGDGRLEVSYTKTTYDIDATVTFTGPGGTSNARLTGQGRRLGNC